MPRGRKPKPKPIDAAPVVKRKRGRPPKVRIESPVVVAPPVISPETTTELPKPKPKPEPPRPPAIPIDPEQQKLIDASNDAFQKKMDSAMKNATSDNALKKALGALGDSAGTW